MDELEKKQAYQADITYGTNNEFGFDYLRDNMKYDLESLVQKELNYAIVDEIDSILIDEARTPLIISGPADDQSEKYKISDKAVFLTNIPANQILKIFFYFQLRQQMTQFLLS